MKLFAKYFLTLSLLFTTSIVFAGPTEPPLTKADIKYELINSLEKDGYLSEKMTNEVKKKYVVAEDLKPIVQSTELNKTKLSSINTTSWFSWVNFIKVVGIIFLLVAFSGFIQKVMTECWVFIASVPVYIYQSVFGLASLVGLLNPSLIWASQSFYVALFSSFALLFVLGWIFASHPKLEKLMTELFSFKLPVETIVTFYGMIYFCILATVYESSIFGLFACICLSGLLSFSMYYAPGVLSLGLKDNKLNASLVGHVLVLSGYVYLFKTLPQSTTFFDIGFQYYCTIALGVTLLIGASPHYEIKKSWMYLIVSIIIFALANYAYFFMDLKVIGSIIDIFSLLILLNWILYLGYKTGFLVGTALVGAILYQVALVFEKYSDFFILTLN